MDESKLKDAQRDKQIELLDDAAKIPAMSINNFLILQAGDQLRLVFADNITPQSKAIPRSVVIVPIDAAKAMANGLLNVIEQIEALAKDKSEFNQVDINADEPANVN